MVLICLVEGEILADSAFARAREHLQASALIFVVAFQSKDHFKIQFI